LKSARAQIGNAIKAQPNEALFYITQGQLNLADKATAAAQKSFAKAVQLNPEYYMGHLGLGMAYKASKKHTQAKAALVSSMKILAGDGAHAKEYFTYAAQGSGQVAEAAKAQLAKLNPAPAQAPQ